MSSPDDPGLDGRRQRSERSRKAIIEATLEFMNEGLLIPTAQQIADRAGVGIRSFFRHFSDMDSLFAAVDSHERASYESFFSDDENVGSLEDRIARTIEIVTDGYEALANMILSTLAQRWRSEELRKNYARNQRLLSKKVGEWLPESKGFGREDRHALEAILSFDFWYRLREHQGLGVKAGRKLVSTLVVDLFDRHQ